MTPSIQEMIRVFGRIGLLSFGGPAAQIALMHKELVEARPWLSERQYLGALSFCMLLPGPEAMQLATYAGWRLRGVRGGLIAGGLFVLPGACVILAMALIYANFGAQPIVQALFLGIKAAIIVVVIQALRKVAAKALTGEMGWAIAGLSFLGLFAFDLPFPVIILAAGLWGAVFARRAETTAAPVLSIRPVETLRTVGIGLVLWAVPVVVSMAMGATLMTELGLFFSKLAVVTFGGAYAVLAYMTQEVVQAEGWLTTAQMMDGLGLAETTPGPLILVTEFVGSLTAYAAGGWTYAVLGAVMTLWVTFVPCFVWIFAGAPYIDWITHQPGLKAALDGITAAVVGVIANLSLWFAAHVFFADVGQLSVGPLRILQPQWSSLDLGATILAAIAAVLLMGLRWSLVPVLGLMALLGWALSGVL